MNRWDSGQTSTLKLLALAGTVLLVVIAALILNRSGSDDVSMVVSAPEQTEAHRSERGESRAGPTRTEAPRPEAPSIGEHAPATSRELRLHGIVTSADSGGPVSGAEVLLFLDEAGPLVNPAREVRADDEGNYEIILTAEELPRRSTVLAARAEGYAAERDEVFKGRPDSAGAIRKDFVLRPGGSVAGVVRNERGTPLSGAVVSLASFPERSELYSLIARGENPHRFFPAVETDGNGYFQLEGIARQPNIRLYTEREGYLKGLTDPVALGVREIEIILRDGEASLSGFVYDSDGTPVADLPVRTLHGGASQNFQGLMRALGERDAQLLNIYHTTTDSRGHYSFPALRSGSQSVLAGFGAPSSRSVAESILLAHGAEERLNLRFPPSYLISGVVVDRESREPVPGVTLTANPTGSPLAEHYAEAGGGSGQREFSTDQLGRFQIEIEPRVETQIGGETRVYYRVPVNYDPMNSDNWQARTLTGGQLSRLDGGEGELTIEVDRARLIKGVVVYEDEENGDIPVSGATVRWSGEDRPNWLAQLTDGALEDAVSTTKEVATLSDGTFELWAPVSGGRGRNPQNNLEAEADGVRGAARVRIADGEAEEVRITLEPRATLSGRAVDPDGQGVGGIEIQAIRMERRGRGAPDTTPEIPYAMTGEDGRFRMENIRAGRTMLIASAIPGYVPPDQLNVNLSAGEENEVTIELQRTKPFEGIVVDSEGTPVTGAEVTLTEPRGGWMGRIMAPGAVYTDSGGRFELGNLPAGADALALRVSHVSHETRDVRNLLPEDSPLRITLEGRAGVEFTVYSGDQQQTSFEYDIRPQGMALAAGGGGMMRGGDRMQSRTVHRQAEPVKATLPPGHFTLHVHGIDDSTGRQDGTYGAENFEITSEGGEAVRLEVELSPILTIAGRVVDDEGEGVPGAEVQLHATGQGGGGGRWAFGRRGNNGIVDPVTTDQRGYFLFERMTAGNFDVRAEKDDLVQRDEVTVELASGESPDPVTVELVRGGTIFGKVTGVDGRPMADGWVYVQTPMTDGGRGRRNLPNVADDDHRQELESDGTYRLTALPPGRHDVTVYDRDFGMEIISHTVQLGVHEEAELDFDLQGFVRFDGNLDVTGMQIGRGGFGGSSFRLIPTEETQGGFLLNPNNRADFRVYMRPGTYELNVQPPGFGQYLPTGALVTLRERVPHQSSDIRVELNEVAVVVVSPDGSDFRGGQGRMSVEAATRTVNFRVNLRERISTWRFMPSGLYGTRGLLNGSDGRAYIALEADVGPGEENILTFVSEEDLGL